MRMTTVSSNTRRDEPLTEEQRAFAEQHLHLCGFVARKLARKCPMVAETDFFQTAFEGLADAVKGFDPSLGWKFETYAPRRIVGACLDMLRAEGIIRKPRTARGDGVDLKVLSLDTDLKRGEAVGSPSGVAFFQPSAAMPPPETEMCAAEDFEAMLVGLSEREKSVMRGLYGPVPMTMKQVGHRVDLSESRVSQIHADLLERVKDRARRLGYSPRTIGVAVQEGSMFA